MRTEVIRADSINAAAKRILDQLKGNTSTLFKENVIYFDGWEGLGASAVLRAIAQRLTVASKAPDELPFDQIIHLDCSKWESMRVLQRMIAEQLELPADVMEMFDRQDEEDDFNGVGLEFRTMIEQVLGVMHRHIMKLNHRFLVIFHNGGTQEIDLGQFGFPLSKYFGNKVLWTFQGRFRLYPRMKVDDAMNNMNPESNTKVFLSASHLVQDSRQLWSYLVGKEAAEVALVNAGGIDQPLQVVKCFTYLLNLCCTGHHFRVDYDLTTHGSNYWICDGIVEPQQGEGHVPTDHHNDGSSWRDVDTLQHELRLDIDYYHHNLQSLPSTLIRCAESLASMACCASPTYGVLLFPADDMFLPSHKLAVLKLLRSTFTFSSAPFLRCHNLRFLWLDHCQVQESRGTDGEGIEEGVPQFFQRLWVLDVRYTSCHWILSTRMLELMTHLKELIVMGAQDWDMSQLQGRLPNIRKLRIKKSTIKCSSSCSENDKLFSGMKKIELLDFSGNNIISGSVRSLVMTANNSLLETVIIDEGCLGLEQISFSGCANLKNLLLRGLFEGLKSIDMSGTAVKTLDLSAVEAKEFDELVALGCGKLCAILWPPETKGKENFRKLHIGTTMEDRTNPTSSPSLPVQYGSRAPTEYDWYISVIDARLFQSLLAFKSYFDYKLLVRMEISTPGLADVGGSKEESRLIKGGVGGGQLVPVNQQKRQQQPVISGASIYADVAVNLMNQGSDDGDAQTITQTWPCPRAPHLNAYNCYVYIQDQPVRRTRLPQGAEGEVISTSSTSMSFTAVPDVIFRNARIMHVHDSKSIRYVPSPLKGSSWRCLQWCRVERCPGLDSVFVCPQAVGSSDNDRIYFYYLETIWCSQLPKVRCIWNFNGLSSAQRFHSESFEDLTLVHMDLCPRLTHVLPLFGPIDWSFLRRLETLEIVWCGDIWAVFPFDNTEVDQSREEDEQEEATTEVIFRSLKRMHLHELPKLQGICGRQWIYAPNLESIKVRGCWSLMRLPAVGGGFYKNKVKCDCEKEWWDKLKCDGKNQSHYEPMHPRHNKKILLRSSVLLQH